MTNIGLLGANGRMGRAIIDAISQAEGSNLTAATVRAGSSLIGVDAGTMAGIERNNILLGSSLDESKDAVDVVIDFTLPSILAENLDVCDT